MAAKSKCRPVMLIILPPGHDGWVVGDETVIAYEIMDSGKDFGPWKSAG